MTCEKCIALKHYACAGRRGGECACSVCGSTLQRDKKIVRRVPRRKPGASQYKRKSTLTGQQLVVKEKYGIRTGFTPEQVELIFRRKETGGTMGTISAIARELGTTRDRVRTVYYSEASPEAGCPHCGRPF
jgi:hypothetical protein